MTRASILGWRSGTGQMESEKAVVLDQILRCSVFAGADGAADSYEHGVEMYSSGVRAWTVRRSRVG